ncbi:kinase-like protein [Auricularia subglabra TFB-10046 SS5]|uniref:Kinase-like protein n=1 Tax=Auricularia subglabra (strain TFB-10046 / SS5) TaxID=717982 RepID=J0LGE5_AURST|nr:kinase-like protein [Auricularia subglabra TFB-10046 SS5]
MAQLPRLDELPQITGPRNGELFTRLLWYPADGHALFYPNDACEIGDCGYIYQGSFTKLLNVRDPGHNIEAFPISDNDIKVDDRENFRHHLQSSSSRTVTFGASMSTGAVTSMPEDIHPAQVEFEVSRMTDNFAFLAYAGSTRRFRTLKRPISQRLEVWLAENSGQLVRELGQGMVVITTTVTSAGWVGGVSHRQGLSTAGRMVADCARILTCNLLFKRSRNVDRGFVRTGGPPRTTNATWSASGEPNYTIVVEYLQVGHRLAWPRRPTRVTDSRPQPSTVPAQVPQTSQENREHSDDAHDSRGDGQGTSLPQHHAAIPYVVDTTHSDSTVLSEILEEVGRHAQDDVDVVIASSGITTAYFKANNARPNPTRVVYHVERVPISNGRFALQIVDLRAPGRLAFIRPSRIAMLERSREPTAGATGISEHPIQPQTPGSIDIVAVSGGDQETNRPVPSPPLHIDRKEPTQPQQDPTGGDESESEVHVPTSAKRRAGKPVQVQRQDVPTFATITSELDEPASVEHITPQPQSTNLEPSPQRGVTLSPDASSLRELETSTLLGDVDVTDEGRRFLGISFSEQRVELPKLLILMNVVIGTGSHGRVYAGEWGDRKVAVKTFLPAVVTPSMRDMILGTQVIWKTLSHPRILPFLGTCQAGILQPCLVSPLMENGNLDELLEKSPLADRLKLLQEVAEGVDYLHTRARVVHGNLKPRTILISETVSAIIGNFTLSVFIDAPGQPEDEAIRRLNTLSFAAPELLTDEAYESSDLEQDPSHKRSKTTHSDSYAFGMLVYAAYTGGPPWRGIGSFHITSKVISGECPPRTDVFWGNDRLWELCKACWGKDPYTRPNSTHILRVMTELAESEHDNRAPASRH